MNKGAAFLLILLLTPLIAGLYGILHDQLTYTIAPEYYTRFKFFQFGLAITGEEAHLAHPRVGVAIVGFLATWWTGIFIGIFTGLTSLIFPSGKIMFRRALQSLAITLVIAFVTGICGLLYGIFVLAPAGVDWILPKNLVDEKAFIEVGSMHNFSYLGGLFGLIGGVIFLVWKKQQSVQRTTTSF